MVRARERWDVCRKRRLQPERETHRREAPYRWKFMCAAASGSYHAHILRQVEEICVKYPVDGFWFDIYHDHNCHCEFCVARMKQENVDVEDEDAVTRSYVSSIREHMRQLRELVARTHPNATVYFNSATHPGDTYLFKERLFDLNTQQELEDLPTTWGGYDKLPIEAKYHLGEGSRVVAMSGKFHKSWVSSAASSPPTRLIRGGCDDRQWRRVQLWRPAASLRRDGQGDLSQHRRSLPLC